MPYAKGEGGRPKGAVNQTTKLVKETFAKVFNDLQEDPEVNLQEWGKQNPTEFYKLASKLIPVQLGNDPDNPITAPAPVVNVYSSAPPLADSEGAVDA